MSSDRWYRIPSISSEQSPGRCGKLRKSANVLGVRCKWPTGVEEACKGDGNSDSDGDEGGEIGGDRDDGEAGKEDRDGCAERGPGFEWRGPRLSREVPEDVRGGELMSMSRWGGGGARRAQNDCTSSTV